MTKVSLDVHNMSYYAFNPQSKELSPQDQKIALAATILMGLTAGLGHLICGIVYGINKAQIDAFRSAALTDDFASAKLRNKKAQEIFEDIQGKIDECHGIVMPICNVFDHMGIHIQGNVGGQRIDGLCRISITEGMDLRTLLDDFKQNLLGEIQTKLASKTSDDYDFSIELLHAKVVDEIDGKFNRYLIVTGSVSKNSKCQASRGPGHQITSTLPAKYRDLAPRHSEGKDRIPLDLGF